MRSMEPDDHPPAFETDPGQSEIKAAQLHFAEMWDQEEEVVDDSFLVELERKIGQKVSDERSEETVFDDNKFQADTTKPTASSKNTSAKTRSPSNQAIQTSRPVTTTTTHRGTDKNTYLIYVSKNAYTIAILCKDDQGRYSRLVKQFSTGIGRSSAQTRTGTFEITGKERWHTWLNRTYSPYQTRYSGGVWIHGPIYEAMDPNRMLPGSYNEIGTACSAGCLRTTCSAAAWIFYNCPVGTKVVVANDSKFKASRPEKLPNTQTWDPTDPGANPEIPVTDFSLNRTSIELQAGLTAKLTVDKIYPKNASTKTFLYESSNKNVVQVDKSGTLTAISSGTAEIVVRADDPYGLSRRCSIRVTPAPMTTTTTTTSKATATTTAKTTSKTTTTSTSQETTASTSSTTETTSDTAETTASTVAASSTTEDPGQNPGEGGDNGDVGEGIDD